MYNCCIRVTALLECFEWTLNKPHNRTVGMPSTVLSIPSGWGSTFDAISFYYDLIFMWCVPLALGIKRAWIDSQVANHTKSNHHIGIL